MGGCSAGWMGLRLSPPPLYNSVGFLGWALPHPLSLLKRLLKQMRSRVSVCSLSPKCDALWTHPKYYPPLPQAAAGRCPPRAAGRGWGPRPPPGAPGHHTVQAGCASRVRCEGVAHPRKPHRPLRVQVRAGREDRATRPPPRDDTGGNDPCSSGRAGYQAPEVQVRGRWIDPSWWQSLKVHPNPWESPDSPCGGSPTPSHFGGVLSLGVIGLAMRRHSLEVHSTLGSRLTCHAATLPHKAGLVQWSERKRYERGVGGSDPAGGNIRRYTPTLGSRRTCHAAALPH